MYLAIILLPLLASFIVGVVNRKISRDFACIFTSTAVVISAIISLVAFYNVGIKGDIIHQQIISWLSAGKFSVNWSIYIDQLTAIMLVVITVVSSVVHIYSIGYMHDDENLPRFMSYLSLFTVCMLLLVTSDNYLQLFFGWEGVGLCSYLLIGFWYKKDEANFAATKAFVVNRVGDFAFILGIIVIYYSFGTLDFQNIFAVTQYIANTNLPIIKTYEAHVLEIISLLLFIGAMGKSAQIGLHVWLPDAMEGPTPVSALIHAATMVTAGVFLLARSSYIFEYAPYVRDFITIIGAVTCIFGAITAIGQNDIKKIIAYSTCSQLGYMFVACGLSAYNAGIFHLYTHAFFKAMLFLGAGSVIHALHEQDIRKMGGLRTSMPLTYGIFIVGSLAIMGIFPLSGFYSKDMIISTAYLAETYVGNVAYRFTVIGAFCTAIYSTKIIVKVFHGDAKHKEKDLEPDLIMNGPLALLMVCTVIAGFIGYYGLDIGTPVYGFFKESIFVKEYEVGEHLPFYIELIPSLMSVMGVVVGYIAFGTSLSDRMASNSKYLYKFVKNKFYFDEIYEFLFVKPSDYFAASLKIIDKKFVDFIGPTLVSIITASSAKGVAYCHNGSIGRYMTIMVASVVLCLTFLVYKFVI